MEDMEDMEDRDRNVLKIEMKTQLVFSFYFFQGEAGPQSSISSISQKIKY